MSARQANEPECHESVEPPARAEDAAALALVIEARARDLGGFSVRRYLPAAKRRLVGPFVFVDEMGPAAMPAGSGMDVRPHPHIGLATVTYLFEGAILHRDSLGTAQRIAPGEINWMTAGRGIVHSERTPDDLRASGQRVHGMQVWVALPRADEETDPGFEHHPASALPRIAQGGVELTLLIGSAYGQRAPVRTFSPTFYAVAHAPRGGSLELPREHEERAALVVSGTAAHAGVLHGPSRALVFGPGRAQLELEPGARVVIFGGAPLEGERFIEWNFVSSQRERIEEAKREWRRGPGVGAFPKVPGDEEEHIPLPE